MRVLRAHACTAVLWYVDRKLNTPGQGIGLLGRGHGAVQVAITGAPWLPSGWTGVELLFLLCGAKLVAASLTLGRGGSGGDFAPSPVLGGAADIAQPPVSLAPDDTLRAAVESMQSNTLREVPVVDATGRIIGLLDEADVSRAYLLATVKLQGPADATPYSSR